MKIKITEKFIYESMRYLLVFTCLFTVVIAIWFYCNIFHYYKKYKKETISTQYTVCFTPTDQCEGLIVDEINNAHKSILIQAYHLTSPAIVSALLAKHQQNVPITVILDKTARKEAIPFIKEKIPVYIDGKVRIAHNKVMIIDDAITITGSYNFTRSAELRNAENLLVIDNAALSKAYEDNFYGRLGNSKEIR